MQSGDDVIVNYSINYTTSSEYNIFIRRLIVGIDFSRITIEHLSRRVLYYNIIHCARLNCSINQYRDTRNI